jgi:hypothetical protein
MGIGGCDSNDPWGAGEITKWLVFSGFPPARE